MYNVTLGGWYQRTTLHLSEIYDFFYSGRSKLNLSPARLIHLSQQLNLENIKRETDLLEYISAVTKNGISIRYYEDGLYTLETTGDNVASVRQKLNQYLNNYFLPAISYIFSLGAPTPKVLAEIKTIHPTVVTTTKFDHNKSNFGEIYGRIDTKKFSLLKTPEYIIITANKEAPLRSLVETQIFFREFKDQLERYLNIHREIWEEISEIKESGTIRGRDVEPLRLRLDSYQKTINLINSRINQMGSYVSTRTSIARQYHLEDQLLTLFQYKFETLSDTHNYIKEIWRMTDQYLNTAIQVLVEAKNRSANNSIQSLRLITTVGVLSGIVGYISRDKLPSITPAGLAYFLLLLTGTYVINGLITYVYQNIKYELKFSSKN